MFCRVCHVAAPVGRQPTLFGRDRQVSAPAENSAVTDCILLLARLMAMPAAGPAGAPAAGRVGGRAADIRRRASRVTSR